MRALISGINGQDGSYLAELLLSKNYEVHGTIRRSSHPNLHRIAHLMDDLTLHYADLSDAGSLALAVQKSNPAEVYNLAAMSDVRVSFDVPEYAGNVTGLGVVRLLEAIRQHNPKIHFYQAGSSEMHGMNPDVPCNEESPFIPGSPYAAAKVYAHNVVKNYRESYGMHASNGILYNHESERRGVEFVTRKITLGIADIMAGRKTHITLGNIGSKRDWGYAPDFVEGMWMMLQQDKPGDYVLATGETYSVRDFLDEAFAHVGLDWRKHVLTDSALFRPEDPPVLLGDYSKASEQLGWYPKTNFQQLVKKMVEADTA